MKNLVLVSVLLFSSLGWAWGPTGHRTVAEIAQRHLHPDVAARLKTLLGGYTLADVANWADDRSQPEVIPFLPLHYVNVFPEFKTYQQSPPTKGGDVFTAIIALIDFLRSGSSQDLGAVPALAHIDKVTAVKLLVHWVGDVHQPLHCIEDRDKEGHKLNGGNLFKVNWMGRYQTALHSIWDDEMIDFERYSYTEYARVLDHVSPADIDSWSHTPVVDWVNESLGYRDQIFSFPDKPQPAGELGTPSAPAYISYNYIQNQRATIRKRLTQGGVRLAYFLNMLL
jgi:hypothetical protein